MSAVVDRIAAIGIMPVITKFESYEDCSSLAQALTQGGIPAMEITFRMENAAGYIRYTREHCPQILVGAGTVLTLEQAQQAVEAGAQFLVAPGLNPEIVRYAQKASVDIFPGVATPSEIEQAMALGLKHLKFFPAEQMGGVATIKAICGPYKGLDFMPTGGVNLSNLAEYFACDRILACGGTYMLGNHLAKREWGEITALCRKSVQVMLGITLAHVGLNAPDAEDARHTAAAMADLLRLDVGREGSSSVFVEQCVEIVKGKGRGKNGHIGLATPCLERAVRYFRAMGVPFDEDSAKYGADGKLSAIYFTEEFGGFAIHLTRA